MNGLGPVAPERSGASCTPASSRADSAALRPSERSGLPAFPAFAAPGTTTAINPAPAHTSIAARFIAFPFPCIA
ncbi:hypothetical protein GCM10028781_36610 [Nostocoides australiense]